MTLNHIVHYHIENEEIVLELVNLEMMKIYHLDYSMMMMMEEFLFKFTKKKFFFSKKKRNLNINLEYLMNQNLMIVLIVFHHLYFY
jgi:hypothetical protein